MSSVICSSLELGWQWIVLLDYVEDVNTEVRHILCNNLTEVIHMVLLAEDHLVFDLTHEPLDIRRLCQLVNVSIDQSSWHIKLVDSHLWWCSLPILFHVPLLAIVKEVPIINLGHLGLVLERLVTGAAGFV